MPDLDTQLRGLRTQTFESGHRFANGVQSRLDALLQAVETVAQHVPAMPEPEELGALRSNINTALLPAYQELAAAFVSPEEMSAAFREWLTELDRSVQALPETVEAPEPDRLYAASPADGPVTTVRKSMVRLGRKFSQVDGSRVRDVPLRNLGSALVREWLPVQFGKVLDDDRKRLARHQSGIEKAVSDLVYATLRAENQWRLVSDVPPGDDSIPREVEEGEEPDAPGPVTDYPEDFREAMTRLEGAVERFADIMAAASNELMSAAAQDVERRMEQALIPLGSEVEQAGSFMTDIPEIDDTLFQKRLDRIDAQASDWKQWKTRLISRGAYLSALMALRNDLDLLVNTTEKEVVSQLVEPTRKRAATVISKLQETESELAGHYDSKGLNLSDGKDHSLKTLGERAIRHVQEGLVEPIQDLSLLTRISDENQAFLDGLSALIESLPEPFRLHALAADLKDAVDPDEESRVVALKEVVSNSTAEIDAEKLEARTDEARDDLKEALEELISLPSIVRFSFESATETHQGENAEQESQDTDQMLTMMQESLQRTRDAIGSVGERIEVSAAMLIHVYRTQTLRAWVRIQERLQVEHQVGAYVMDVRSRLDAEAREAGQRLSRLSRQLRLLSERLFRRGQREAKALIERGKEAVGTPSPTRASFHDTALGLAELEQVLEGVPTVYRKLFSFQPLSDPDLLIGRSESLTFVENQLHQFDLGMPQAAMVVGGPSSGRTSLLNIIQATDLAGRSVHTLRFTQRPKDSHELLHVLSESLELSFPQDEDIPETAASLLAQMDPETAPVCILEHLEVLMLRGIGGFDLLVDLLQFMSLTDSRIVWIGTMSSFAWQLVKTADPDSAALVSVHAMTDLSRPDLERLIMERHRKSGIPIEFVEPEEPSPLLRRRLRRVSSRDVRQQLLKEAFFDRLYSQFGQNIQMALLQWIRSVRMSDDASSMQVYHTPALNLSFFAGFNLDQVFTLKALLEHGSLSPDEYADIDRLPEDKALTLFETLGNSLVIETAEQQESGRLYRHAAVESSKQYRIRPLFAHAVVRLLRERNVVH